MMKTYCMGAKDKDLVDEFKRSGYWGMECLINLKGCDKELMKDVDATKRFIVELCDVIDMKRYGEPVIERFGAGELFGISFMQLIHTSSIIGHYAENTGEIYIDCFSCKFLEPSVATDFAKKFYGASEAEYITIFRD